MGKEIMSLPDRNSGSSGLKVSENGHYFMYDGAPFFWLGDTNWPLYIRYTPEEMEFYLEQRCKQGFTAIHTMIVFDGGPGLVTPYANHAGQLPWYDMNPATPNETFFRYVDLAAELTRQKGMLLVIMPCGGSSGSFISQKKIITPENARIYGRWLGLRYQHTPNILWANGADLLPWEYENIYHALAAGLQEGDGGAHLISLHPGGRPGISSSYFQQVDWLAANIIQTWSDYWAIYPLVNHDYHLSPAKPVIMAEGAYEEGEEYPTRPITPLIVRKQAYWSVLAGGFHSYGHNAMWRKSPGWAASMDAPGARQMGVLKSLFTTLEWWKLAPDQAVIKDGVGEGKNLNAAACSQDGRFIVVYLSSPSTVNIDLGKITAGETARAEWIDPQTGEHTSAGTFPAQGEQTFTTPIKSEDAVLIIAAS